MLEPAANLSFECALICVRWIKTEELQKLNILTS